MHPTILDQTDATRGRRLMRTVQRMSLERVIRRRALVLPDEAMAEGPACTSPIPQRLTYLLHRVRRIRAGCYDRRFERPDLVEDDYYRFRNAPCGW
jgi:hypothetical protein